MGGRKGTTPDAREVSQLSGAQDQRCTPRTTQLSGADSRAGDALSLNIVEGCRLFSIPNRALALTYLSGEAHNTPERTSKNWGGS